MYKINTIDIGAVGGFDIPWKNHLDKIEHSLSFEPNETPILEGKNLRYNCAIWNFNGQGKFYVSGPNGVGSSLLEQNYDWVRDNFSRIRLEGNRHFNDTWFERSRTMKEFECPVKTLDSVLKEVHCLNPDLSFHFLKSDTQSGEFFVLEGAREFLASTCLGLELELFRYPLYKGIVLEDLVKEYLFNLGFEVAGWTGYLNSFHASSDYLFLRSKPRSDEELSIIQQIKSIYNPRGNHHLIKKYSVFEKVKYRIKKMMMNGLKL